MLAELVDAGKLPPVVDRLPAQPLVLQPLERVGAYGGTLRQAFSGTGDETRSRGSCTTTAVLNTEVTEVVPNIAREFHQSRDGRECTLQLREGMRWSTVIRSARTIWCSGGTRAAQRQAERVQAAVGGPGWQAGRDRGSGSVHGAVSVAGAEHAVPAVDRVVRGRWAFDRGGQGLGMFSPAHYMKQFHAEHADPDALRARSRPPRCRTGRRCSCSRTTRCSILRCPPPRPGSRSTRSAPARSRSSATRLLRRGHRRQPTPLHRPHPGHPHHRPPSATLNAAAGKFDFQWRDTRLSDYPVYQRNRGRGRYGVRRWATVYGTEAGLFCNQSYERTPSWPSGCAHASSATRSRWGSTASSSTRPSGWGSANRLSRPRARLPLLPRARITQAQRGARRQARERAAGRARPVKGDDGLRRRDDGKGVLTLPMPSPALRKSMRAGSHR